MPTPMKVTFAFTAVNNGYGRIYPIDGPVGQDLGDLISNALKKGDIVEVSITVVSTGKARGTCQHRDNPHQSYVCDNVLEADGTCHAHGTDILTPREPKPSTTATATADEEAVV